MDDLFGQVSQALEDGATRPEAFTLFLRLLSSHFDRVDSGAGYKTLRTFDLPNGTVFCEFSRKFPAVVSAATRTARLLAPVAEILLEVVRMAVNEKYPSLMPTLHPGGMAAKPRPFGTLDDIWLAFQTFTNKKTPAINGKNIIYTRGSSTRWADARPGSAP